MASTDNHIKLRCIDDINIPESVIYNCRKSYMDNGKLGIYDIMDNWMYRYEYADKITDRNLRYLYLYRRAFLESKGVYNKDSNPDNYILSEPKKLKVDPTRNCVYCGSKLEHMVNTVSGKLNITTTLNESFSIDNEKEFVSAKFPSEAFGLYSKEEYKKYEIDAKGKTVTDEELTKLYYAYMISFEKFRLVHLKNYEYTFNVNGVELTKDDVHLGDKHNKNEDENYFYIRKEKVKISENNVIIITSKGITNFKICNNRNCFVNTRNNTRIKWEWTNNSAYVSKLDPILVGYVPVAGFRLDDYSYDYNYEQSILTMKKRGGGIGFPQSRRFDFEYKFVDAEKLPEYISIYKHILYNTFCRILYVVTLNNFSMLKVEEIDTMLNIISELSVEYKCKLMKFTYDFMMNQKNKELLLYGSKDNKKLSETIKNDTNKLIEEISVIHEELMLPAEFMCLMILLISYPRHMLILSNDKGDISSKLFYTNKVYIPTDKTDIAITHQNGTPISFATPITGIPIGNIVENEPIYLYENYYVMADKDFNLSIFSFLKSKWINSSESNIFNKPFNTSKIIKMMQLDIKNNKCLGFLTNDEFYVFNFSKNEWFKFGDKYTIDKSDVFESDNFIDIDYDDKLNRFAIISNSKFIVYDVETNTIVPESLFETEDVVLLDTSGKKIIDNYYIDNTNKVHLSSFNKVSINASIETTDSVLDYFTLTDNSGNIQIIKYNRVNKTISVFQTIRFVDKYSEVVSIINIRDYQNIYIVYKNKRVLSISTFMYNVYTLQNPEEIKNQSCKLNKKITFSINKNSPDSIDITKTEIDTTNESNIIQNITLEELNIPQEYKIINGIDLNENLLLRVDIKEYGIIEVQLKENESTADANRNIYIIEEINKYIGEQVIVVNKFKHIRDYYITYITDMNNMKEVYAFYEMSVNKTRDAVDMVEYMDKDSKVVSYDQVFIRNTNIDILSRTPHILDVYTNKDKFISKR